MNPEAIAKRMFEAATDPQKPAGEARMVWEGKLDAVHGIEAARTYGEPIRHAFFRVIEVPVGEGTFSKVLVEEKCVDGLGAISWQDADAVGCLALSVLKTVVCAAAWVELGART